MDRRALLGLKTQPLKTGGGGGAAAPQASYLRLPTITANVMRPGGRRGVMTVETGIDTPDAALRTRVAQSAPRLRAAYAAVVQQSASALLPGSPPDVERLVAQLQAATNTVMGRAGARLLIGTVMVV
ncbi:MAG: Tat pathway signal protein [Brevundimonas sp.]|uniref:Tat pathway signal protein n=1 Tax=Brevundimonas sp. TaxID=1871086 RepID=UPI002718A620|nr:Tat pathway signal protein [Brevundimonas sp.]MDO9586625.1 Tat pathway signal protein [Brevundimonas sp.]MDP3657022.1 Tat pathway signal protein [Brevundimonas sp.]